MIISLKRALQIGVLFLLGAIPLQDIDYQIICIIDKKPIEESEAYHVLLTECDKETADQRCDSG